VPSPLPPSQITLSHGSHTFNCSCPCFPPLPWTSSPPHHNHHHPNTHPINFQKIQLETPHQLTRTNLQFSNKKIKVPSPDVNHRQVPKPPRTNLPSPSPS
jgi:hypothetical protein